MAHVTYHTHINIYFEVIFNKIQVSGLQQLSKAFFIKFPTHAVKIILVEITWNGSSKICTSCKSNHHQAYIFSHFHLREEGLDFSISREGVREKVVPVMGQRY